MIETCFNLKKKKKVSSEKLRWQKFYLGLFVKYVKLKMESSYVSAFLIAISCSPSNVLMWRRFLWMPLSIEKHKSVRRFAFVCVRRQLKIIPTNLEVSSNFHQFQFKHFKMKFALLVLISVACIGEFCWNSWNNKTLNSFVIFYLRIFRRSVEVSES